MSFADDEVNRVSKVLSSVLNIPNPRIEERTFVRDWFNIVFGRPNTVHDRIPILRWVDEVAGSPYTEVDVTRNGEVIFTIPPILDSTLMEVTPGLDLQTILSQYRDERATSQKLGEQFFNQVVMPNLAVEVVKTEDQPYRDRLYEIAKGYGLIAPDASPTDESAASRENIQYEDLY